MSDAADVAGWIMITSPLWLAVAGGLSGPFDDLFGTSEDERYAKRTVGPPVTMRRCVGPAE
jgi:hypothetical protein